MWRVEKGRKAVKMEGETEGSMEWLENLLVESRNFSGTYSIIPDVG